MKKLLFQTDSSLAKTGFGRNAKALLSYLYKTKKYDVVQYCCGTDYSNAALKTTPWKSIGTLPDDVRERQRISQDPGQARLASYGGHLIDKVMREEKPDFYFGVQDIWGTEFAVGKPWFDKINSVIWSTLDSLPILPTAVSNAPKIKNYWIWSSFATKALHEMGHKHVKTVHGCVESQHFTRLSDEERFELRELNNIDQDAFIVGFVFRNQLRKSVPNLLEGYAEWKKKHSPKKPHLLFHTYWKEGWNIHKLATEYGIKKEEILTTYVCRKCSQYEIKEYKGEDQNCARCGSEKSQVTTNVGCGVRENQLNEVYNFMDVYWHPLTSGGQEIPIQEAKLTELITLVTNYSCGEENCEEGSESIVLEWSEYREHQTEFKKASTCPHSIAQGLGTVYQMSPAERREKGKLSRQWVLDNFSVEVIGKIFEDFIDNAEILDYDFGEEESSEDRKKNNPHAVIPPIESNSEWVLTLYKEILVTDNHVNDDGYKNWMTQLEHKVPRSQIEDYFRKVAREHNQKYFPVKIEDFLDDDKGKRIAYVMPESAVDVFLSTSLLKSIKLKYPDHNLYFVTKPEYNHILDGNEYIHKIIPYNSQFDNTIYLEGSSSDEGEFEIAFTPHLTTQRLNNYIHNDKDRIDTQALCTF